MLVSLAKQRQMESPVSTFTANIAAQPKWSFNLDAAAAALLTVMQRLDHSRMLRRLSERERADAGLPVELDGPYSEVFRNIGWK